MCSVTLTIGNVPMWSLSGVSKRGRETETESEGRERGEEIDRQRKRQRHGRETQRGR